MFHWVCLLTDYWVFMSSQPIEEDTSIEHSQFMIDMNIQLPSDCASAEELYDLWPLQAAQWTYVCYFSITISRGREKSYLHLNLDTFICRFYCTRCIYCSKLPASDNLRKCHKGSFFTNRPEEYFQFCTGAHHFLILVHCALFHFSHYHSS